MWFSDASSEVKDWALEVLDEEPSTPNRHYPHGLVD